MGVAPPPPLLQVLRRAWDNEGYTATLPYLQEVATRAATAEGPILECGSGVTTIVLGALAGRRGVAVHTLEHDPAWRDRVAELLQRYRIPGVHLHLAPIIDRGAFDWYEVPKGSWPDEFGFVVCDGPPGDTKGGRYGLLPVLGARLRPGSIILLDDATRPGEMAVRRRWRAEREVRERVEHGPDRGYAVLTLGST